MATRRGEVLAKHLTVNDFLRATTVYPVTDLRLGEVVQALKFVVVHEIENGKRLRDCRYDSNKYDEAN